MGDYRHNPPYMEDINTHLLFTVPSPLLSNVSMLNTLTQCMLICMPPWP